MTDVEHISIDKKVPISMIEEEIRGLDSKVEGCKKIEKARQRLGFIRLRYLGYPVLDCAKILSINPQTGYNWQAAWNESGMDSVIPNYGGGRPSKITEEQRSRLKEQVDRDNMTTGEARQFMKDVFHVEYSVKQVHVILSGMGLRHAKPYSIDYRRPDDAGQRLKKTSELCWKL
ncbi:MAG: helix-turn-helix domain-containing protein [Candidatus Methanomethylophilaceae archaeon]|nr:helix-turn-helix domain-containing protein [Candidatus Methanomethylophilaceae archaeon]